MAKKKLTRKELLKQPDEILTLSSRLFNWSVTYRYQLIGVLGAVIAIVAAVTFVRYYTDKTAKAGFSQLQQIRIKYETALRENDPAEAYRQVQQDYEDLLEAYGGTQAGKLGRFVYAGIAYRGGDAEKSIALYREALAQFDDPYFQNQILIGLAYAHEAQGNLAEAVRTFETVSPTSNAFQKGEALYNLARLYATMGQEEKSREAYRKIIADNADTIYAEMVQERNRN